MQLFELSLGPIRAGGLPHDVPRHCHAPSPTHEKPCVESSLDAGSAHQPLISMPAVCKLAIVGTKARASE
eukprot:scaffold137604_cov323-Phaeocystis_antarctica.AAC.1